MLFWLLIWHTKTPFTNSKFSFPYPFHRTPLRLSFTSIGLSPPHPIPETVSYTPYILCTFHNSFDLPSPRTQSRNLLLYYVTCHLRRWHQHTSYVRIIAMFVTRQYMTCTHQVEIVVPLNSHRGLLSTWSIFWQHLLQHLLLFIPLHIHCSVCRCSFIYTCDLIIIWIYTLCDCVWSDIASVFSLRSICSG